jgi:hypothetical protein
MAITGTWKWYGLATENLARGLIDLEGGAIKCALTTVTYVPAQDTDEFYDDISNELPTAGGYTAGGQALTGQALSYTAISNIMAWDFNNPTWLASTFTCRVAVLYLDTGVPGTSPLIGFCVFSGDASPSSGTLEIIIDLAGCLKLTAAA